MTHPATTDDFPAGVTHVQLQPDAAASRLQRQRTSDRERATLDSARLGAALVDLWVPGIVAAFVGWLALHASSTDLSDRDRALVALFVFVVIDLLAPLRPGRRRGQTVGKQLLGLRVERVDGRPLGAGTMLLRGLLRWIAWSRAIHRLRTAARPSAHLHERRTATVVRRAPKHRR